MKALLATILLFAAAPAAADVSIVANKAKKTVDCKKHKSVNIVGNHAKVTLKGQCEKIMIAGNHARVTGSATAFYLAGNHNIITADATDEITIPGNHNTVTWKRGASVDAPAISAPGNENKVSKQE
jgi:hypothetical protein